KQPWIAIGSDSRANAPYGPLSFGKPHPRSYGTFPRVLGHYARDEGVLTLEDAVRKMTSLTATHLRLHDRGVVRVGAWADLVVIDPSRVRDAATFDDPHRYPEGVDYVVVNGALAVEQGETKPPTVAILAEGQFARATAKTAIGVLRYAPYRVVAVIDSTRAGTDASEHVG